ncbi:MAG: 4a-hydroxytetrahydrobiopterin dehydratase [Candidatus Aenigmarchaeota archaeon]|nr:4a-hydroxytetrahydrobiopterin dehydratase [Candidatus Aenigmarchaeota archaeon]
MDLVEKKCISCEGYGSSMSDEEALTYIKKVKNWSIANNRIEKNFKFKNFLAAMKFVNSVASLAEQEGHHPDIHLYGWNKVKIITFTHALNGLTENDFILAAKIDEINLENRRP